MARKDRLEQHHRDLVRKVTNVARPGRLDEGELLRFLASHPWYRYCPESETRFILARKEGPLGTVTGSDGHDVVPVVGVKSWGVLPAGLVISPPVAAEFTPAVVTLRGRADYESDRETLREKFDLLRRGDVARVGKWVEEQYRLHPDLVRGAFNWCASAWNSQNPTWLGGVQGAFLLALDLLVQNRHDMRRDLRWCDCGPWFPPARRGRYPRACEKCHATWRKALPEQKVPATQRASFRVS